MSPLERHDGEVRPGDEPTQWLVDSGTSNHFSPFKFLFLSLTPLDPPINVLTGNGWITAESKGTIPLIIKVHNRVEYVHVENVLYIPSQRTRVNLFSIVVLAERGLHSDFGPVDVKFMNEGEIVASGTKIGNCW